MSWKRTRCVITHCNSKTSEERKLFRFPKKDTNKYNEWLTVLEKECQQRVQNLKKPYICSLHFESTSIGKQKLRQKCKPTLFLKENDLRERECSESSDINEFYFNPENAKINYLTPRNTTNLAVVEAETENLNEIQILTNSYVNDRNSDEIPVMCSSCEKNSKKQSYYIKKMNCLKKENKILKTKVQKYKKLNARISRKVYRLKEDKKTLQAAQKQSICKKIDADKELNQNTKTFAKLILSQGKKPYKEDEKCICQCIFFRSASGYNFLRDHLKLHLPHASSLHRWIQIKSLSPGMNSSVLQEIRNVTKDLAPKDREVVLIFDEMSIQSNLTYNKYKDIVEGFVDYGRGIRKSECAKSVCVFMIRSVCGKFKQVLYHVACPSNIPTEELEKEVKNCLEICNHLNLNVRAICCDQGPTNRKLYKQLNINLENFQFNYKGKKTMRNV